MNETKVYFLYLNSTIKHKTIKMKPQITLTIISAFCLLQAFLFIFFAGNLMDSLINSSSLETLKIAELMHNGFAPAFIMIGLIFFLNRNETNEVAKKLLLAYIIGAICLFIIFFGCFTNVSLINFSPTHLIPDFAIFLLALVTYFRIK